MEAASEHLQTWSGLAGLVLVILLVWGLVRQGRRGPVEEASPERALQEAGFLPLGPRWVRALHGSQLVFEPGPARWRWSLQLPHYGTLVLHLRERAGQGMRAFGRGTFLTRHPRLDERFVVSSAQRAATLELLADPEVQEHLLALPAIELTIAADELILVHEADAAEGSPADVQRRAVAAIGALVRRLTAPPPAEEPLLAWRRR